MKVNRVAMMLAAMAVCASPAMASAQVKHFQVQSTGGSRVIFESDAPLETITGVTSRIQGDIHVDPNDLDTVRGTLRVPVASIRTGVDLRDEHLRSEDWLDAANHPNATFEITGVSGADRLTPNEETRLRVHGRFTIHGRTHTIAARARVFYRPAGDGQGPLLRVRARFTVQLPRYGVDVPAIVRLKVSDEIRVRVSLRAHPVD